ncbi:hypothetical protein ACFV0T_34845 [Streptomyces sp. NPDC059582]|uniref:hypothetical protein n=1 Tax=Streptomyces sp. NPDC059582 TaxID=3346875 RepID=UPI003691416F
MSEKETEPVERAEPTEPVESATVAEQVEQAAGPTEPVESATVAEPAEQAEQVEQAGPAEQVEQAGPAEQVEPEASEPGASEPVAVEPAEQVEPEASEPGASEPVAVEPAEQVEPEVPESAAPVAEVPEAVVPAPARKRLRKGRIAAVAGSVLLAGAVVAGVGYTVVTVNGADRDAGAPVWKFPKPQADTRVAPAQKGLAGMLVPYGSDGWSKGPDLLEYGADAQLSGAQATALRKQGLVDLPRTQRKRLEREIDKQRTTGMAMRSYYSQKPDSFGNEDIYAVNIVLAQMDSKAAVRDISTFQNEFLDALDVFRKGPAIKGHKDAKCFLPPKTAKTDLDRMYCSGYVGNVLVTATADGVKPIDTKGVAALLSTQLDRIAEPGEAV